MTDVTLLDIHNQASSEYTASGSGAVLLRCPCASCVAGRSRLRTIALLDISLVQNTMHDTGWAFAPWDGPLARFPGTQSAEGNTAHDVVRHRRRLYDGQ